LGDVQLFEPNLTLPYQALLSFEPGKGFIGHGLSQMTPRFLGFQSRLPSAISLQDVLHAVTGFFRGPIGPGESAVDIDVHMQ
jgi:hypothetical protein